jgi:hypothetical protein
MHINRRHFLQSAVVGALGPVLSRATTPAGAEAPAGLGAIRAVTITAADLGAMEAAWTKYMGYKVVSRGHISHATATGWGAPAVKGKAVLTLSPESGENFHLRFVEQAALDAAPDRNTLGWRTTEITVQNSDELFERLKDSPFKVNRPPSLVPTYPYLKAMHATGPAGEELNLTWITEVRPDLAVAKSFVGRCFIAVLAVPDLPGALQFYQSVFGNEPSPIRQLPSLTLAVIRLDDGTKIEVDQGGPTTPPRQRPDGGLPPGMAVVTFETSRFDKLKDRFIAPPTKNTAESFKGMRSGTLRGPGGELIELLSV